jgi:polyhydroxybutyrate depolymerase
MVTLGGLLLSVLGVGPTAAAGVPIPTAPTCGQADTLAGSSSVDVAGRTRNALVYVPDGLDPTVPTSVVLSFHGAGDDSQALAEWDGWRPLADREGFVVVHPQGGPVDLVPDVPIDPGWDVLGLGVDEPAFISALLDELATHVCVDRVYAAGFSLGGAMALSLGCRLGDRVTAVGAIAPFPLYACPEPTRPTPTVLFHGLEDRLSPYGGDAALGLPGAEDVAATIALRNGCVGGAPTATVRAANVVQLTWDGCVAPISLYRIARHGHGWPGHGPAAERQAVADMLAANGVVPAGLTPMQATDNIFRSSRAIDATDVMWELFESSGDGGDG